MNLGSFARGLGRLAAIASAGVLASCSAGFAQIEQIPAPAYADDGTLYVVYRQNPAKVPSSDGVQITHIVGTVGRIQSALDPIAGAGTAALAQIQSSTLIALFDINEVQHTAILNDPATFVKLDSSGNGGKGILCVTIDSRDVASTCLHGTKVSRDGGSEFAPVCALSAGCGGIPPAVVTSLSLGSFNGSAYTFPPPVPTPAPSPLPSTQRPICGPPAPDGFFIPSGASLVFVFNLGAKLTFAMAAAGFTIDTVSPFNATCPAPPGGGVLDATIDQDSIQAVPDAPTPTPTSTPLGFPMPSAPNCRIIVPSGPGALTQNSTHGCGQNWRCTQTDDGDVSYVFSSDGTLIDTYAITAPTPRMEAITSLSVHNRSRAQNVDGVVTPLLRIGNITYAGDPTSVSTAYTDIIFSAATNPSTNHAWQWTELANLQPGVRQQPSSSDRVQTTLVYIEVCWASDTPVSTPTLTMTFTQTGTATPTRTASPTNTATLAASPTPGAGDCCQCPTFCAPAVNGSCGECSAVLDAACTGDGICTRYTPPPTVTPETIPPTPTRTATWTPGTNDCCQCSAACAAPVNGACGSCGIVFDARCSAGHICVAHTPTPTSSPTPTATNTATQTPSGTPTHTHTGTATHTPTDTPTHSPTATSTITSTSTDTPAPTSTPSAMPTGTATPTATSAPSATPSAIATATPSPSPKPCAGDCDNSGDVTIEETVLLVNIALGTAPLARCQAGDRNGDGEITVDDILAAVNNALTGCAPRAGTAAPESHGERRRTTTARL